MRPGRHSYVRVSLIVALATLLPLSACSVGPPTVAECIERWNNSGNRRAQAAVAAMGLPHVRVAGWPSKAGDHCSATFFTRPGEPWVMYVLWLEAPDPTTRFSRNADGSRYGRGDLGAEWPESPNAEIQEDGTLNSS